MNRYEEALARQIELRGLAQPERQYRFAMPHRQYRVDFAWPGRHLAVEVDGGAFLGRGGRGAVIARAAPIGYHQTVEDYRKRNLLNILGWRLLAYQPEQVARGEALTEIELCLAIPAPLTLMLPHDVTERLWTHVARLGVIDKLKRRTREAKASQRRLMAKRTMR